MEYEYTIDQTLNFEDAVTRSGKTFSFSYNQAMTNYADTQTINVKGLNSKTRYENISVATVVQGTDERSFDLSFIDPCITNGFVSVTFSATTGDQTDNYSNTAKTFQINYSITPSWC